MTFVHSDAAVAAPGRSRGRHPVRPQRRRRKDLRWWPFVVPAVALTVAFFLLPFLLNIYFAFTNWTGFSSSIKWNGIQNFIDLADTGVLGNAIRVTITYAIVALVVQNTVSLILALLLQRTSAVNSVFRAAFFVPVLISPVAAGYIWAAILSPHGPLNAAIGIVIPGFDFGWMGNYDTALFTVAFIDAWKWSGLVTLVYIAGLNSIPHSLIEAAMIDGANSWQRFWRVKFRLLAPAFTFSVVSTFLGALSAFDIIQATTGGGPGDATTVLNIAMYRQYGMGFFGSASSLSLVVTILVVALGLPLIAYLRRREIEA
ncbi:carbohydrate ABC transporter permease [Microbacterium azadirachtae]|uniref:Lactose transport system permease protein LacF n=1 Tax=Microbacterium azadirachtae TaxID=582680 RepID=A0A0F0KWY1_9MICO|nr:sugar ABC transporter permease [Microbacterium azadirachtae]KJL24605.1 Lactose transport system permease protein LacF [Microbacterium azadirachtae]UXW85880.1 sugar ABC transporter permease [Microbacterium azadirachtae]SDL69847.1 carbohydrate ABC transporter membrane protein 1, CUT1 family [Microbacterium azadirachtae]SEF99422.1 carbohydrate ABC transporter membrane protein 1, CUT1 family [Microbacterium azadirachtae]SEG01682.1 carbohydrate ABC transporter membrane protein 1, CUT1 family [Mi